MGGFVRSVVAYVLHAFGPLIDRLRAVAPVQAGVILGAQAFLALTPLLMALIALTPPAIGNSILAAMRLRLGITGDTDDMVGDLIGGRDELSGTITAFSALVVLASATAFTRALQRVYENAWALPRLGIRGTFRGLVWMIGFVAYIALLGTVLRALSAAPVGSLLSLAAAVGSAFLLWWWTPYLLLGSRVKKRALVPTAILTAACTITLGVVSEIVVPRTIATNERRFGTIGVVFAIESWLVIVSCVIVGCAVIGAVLVQSPTPLGRFVRRLAATGDGWLKDMPQHRRKASGPLGDILGDGDGH